jgi:hypothetical protein
MSLKSIKKLLRTPVVKHEILSELAKGRNVVHYGCIDDEQIILSKSSSGYYLHDLISKNAKCCVGIDINRDSFVFLQRELSIKNVFYGDVEDPRSFKIDIEELKEVEVLFIPDLIEHLDNPGKMLTGIRKYYSPQVKIIICTPNPFAWYNFAATLMQREIYTPYHTMSFTTENMQVLLDRHGFKIDRIRPLIAPKQRNLVIRLLDNFLGRFMTVISPGFADAFLYECSIT